MVLNIDSYPLLIGASMAMYSVRLRIKRARQKKKKKKKKGI
jgi:hypothetical protein